MSAKADLVAYAATDWHAYFQLFNQMVAAGGFFFFILTVSWIFGREFVDGTLKDLLAVPVPRSSIVLAKFILAVIWSAALAIVIFIVGLCVGALIKLPGGSPGLILQDSALLLTTSCLVILVVLPFALFASIGRGYLLPMGLAVLMLMLTNLVAILGWGEFFPWAIPGLVAQGLPLGPISYGIVILTGLVGMLLTYAWWMITDQR